MEQFRFEHTFKLTEAEYVRLWSPVATQSAVRTVRLIALSAVGVVFLFNSYTLLAGVVLLLVLGLNLFKVGIAGVGARSTFRQHRHLTEALTYGVSEERLWADGRDIEASWSLLRVWREADGWLILSASGIPPVYLPVGGLKERGLYERVRELARRHGTEFNAKQTPDAV